MSTRRKSH